MLDDLASEAPERRACSPRDEKSIARPAGMPLLVTHLDRRS
jgi:hypothetical protein